MPQYPRYTLSGGNQFPTVATTAPAQYPVIELVDSAGTVVSNVGNGPADGTWTTMTITNGSAVSGFPAQYMKDSRGIVHCRGKVTATVAGTSMFTFPVGFRPYAISTGLYYYYHWNVSPHAVRVFDTGLLLPGFSGVEIDLSVIHFPTVLL